MMNKFETIQKKIEVRFDDLSSAERKVARIILMNYPLSGMSTIANISEKAHVSDPTVLRFVNKLGYKKYIDFQNALKQELDQWMQGPLSVYPENQGASSDLNTYLADFKRSLQTNIDNTFKTLSSTEFESILTVLMDNRKNIHLIGGEFTDPITRHLFFHLRKMRPHVHLIQGRAFSRIDHLLDLGKKDVLIVFDVRRYQLDTVDFSARASQKVGSLILITDQWLSPAAKYATYVLSCGVTSVSRWDSLVGLTAVIEALISCFAEEQWPNIKTRLEMFEKIREEINSSQCSDQA